MFKAVCISSFHVLKILKSLVKILNCSTLKSVGSCPLLFMLTICVFNVPIRVWVRNGVQILKGLRNSCYVVPLSWCGHQFRKWAFRWFIWYNYITMHGDKHKKDILLVEKYTLSTVSRLSLQGFFCNFVPCTLQSFPTNDTRLFAIGQ